MIDNPLNDNKRCHSLGVGGFCIHNDSVLLVKHSYGPAKDKWCQPGGFVEVGEILTEALEREIYEETRIRTEASNLIMIRHYNRESKTYGIISDILLLFRLNYISGEPIADLDEIEDAKFIPLSEIDTYPLTNLCKTILNYFIKNNGLELQFYKPPEDVTKNLAIISYQLFI